MNKTALSLLLLAASVAVALYAFQSPTWTPTLAPSESAPPAPANSHLTRRSGSLGSTGPDESAAVRASAATTQVSTGRTPAPSQNTRPYPKHGTWVEVRLLAPNGEPVPDAEVLWFDDDGRAAARSTAGIERWTLLSNHELLAERFGWRTTTDKLGIARVARRGEVVVLGRTDLLRGDRKVSANTPTDPEGRIAIEMRRSKRVRIHVTQADGKPAANVPLTVVSLGPDGKDTASMNGFPIAASDSQGNATIGDLGYWRHALFPYGDQEDAPKSRRVFVKAALRHTGGVAVQVPLTDDDSTDVLQLKLPPLGTVRVGVDLGAHTSLAVGLSVSLTCMDETDSECTLVEEIGADGWAYFQHVSLGERLVAVASGMQQRSVSLTQSGKTTDVILAPSPDSPCLLLRVLAPNGKPSAHRSYQLAGKLDGHVYQHIIQTTRQGRAILTLGAAFPAGSTSEATIELRDFTVAMPNSEELGSGILPSLDVSAGVFDIGDVQLHLPNLFAAGHVVDEQQRPYLQPLEIGLERQQTTATGSNQEPAWQTVHDAVVTLHDGAFEVRADLPAHDARYRYRLQATGEDLLPGAATPLQPGDETTVVEIQTGSSLGLNVRLAERVQTQFVICQLFPQSGQLDPALAQRMKTNPASIGDDRYEVVWRGVPAGLYRLEFLLWGDPAPLLQLNDVRLTKAGGAAHEALNDTIDLREIVQVATLHLREIGIDGTAVPLTKGPNHPQGAVARASSLAKNPVQAVPINDATTRILVRRNSEPLIALVEGYRPSPVRGAGPSRTATLAPWPKLAMRLTISTEDLSPVELPLNTVVEARALPSEPESREWQTPWWQGPLSPLTGSREGWVRLRFAPGSATAMAHLPIGERDHSLELRVRHQQQSASLLDAAYPVTASSGDIQIDLPKVRWQRALDTISQDER